MKSSAASPTASLASCGGLRNSGVSSGLGAWVTTILAMISLRSESVVTTHAIASALAELCKVGDLIVLAGEMGAGKTAFAQGFGSALGINEPITSPTFTLVHSYDTGRVDLHHADLYRLDRMAEIADLALGELLESDGIVLVEWGDVVGNQLGDRLEVRLIAADMDRPEYRMIELTGVGRGWATRWDRLTNAVSSWAVS
jgi:tRNA threonylcarbamoyladenosine biosynthesis protein TsaE